MSKFLDDTGLRVVWQQVEALGQSIVTTLSGLFLQKTGGTMTGTLTMGDGSHVYYGGRIVFSDTEEVEEEEEEVEEEEYIGACIHADRSNHLQIHADNGVDVAPSLTVDGRSVSVQGHKHTKSDISDFPAIPTVNNPTITFTQGGASKGSITLNQSGAKTIALDAGASVTVDTALSDTSESPVQNRVVKAALDGKADTAHTHSEYLSTSGGTVQGGLTVTDSSGGNSGGIINFGDGDYVHISEPTDDHLELKGSSGVNIVAGSSESVTVNGTAVSLTGHTHTEYAAASHTHTSCGWVGTETAYASLTKDTSTLYFCYE